MSSSVTMGWLPLQHVAACCSGFHVAVGYIELQWVTLSCSEFQCDYGVATISRLLKIIGLFCRILSLL